MLKFFGKIRLKLIEGSKTSNYLKYAFGEILLVMLGILLAMQINNWNESRKQQNQFENILETITQDLKRDTLVAGTIIKYYEQIEKSSLKIINKEINRNNYKEYPEARSLVSRYRPFSIQTKGYDLVREFNSKNEIRNDSIFTTITQFYTPFLQIIDDSNEFVKTEVLNNIEIYKTHDWFVDWTQGNYTPEMIIYFTESEEYRKQVASHNLLAGKNHLLFVSTYKQQATKLIDYIDKSLLK